MKWRRPTRPFLILGPDIYGPVLYSSHRTLDAARARARWQAGRRGGLTIVRVVDPGESLNGKMKRRLREESAQRALLRGLRATWAKARP